MTSLKEKAVKGVFWSSVDRFSSQGIQFIFSILIARMLLPSDYGVIAMLGIFLAVSQSFIDSGFGTALVQKIDRTETDFSTVFYFNVLVACFFYGLLWIISPYIAAFYDIPLLESVTKAVALTLIFNALGGIQNAKLTIAIDFKTRAKISLMCTISTGIIGLIMAYKGYEVWALVTQNIANSVLNATLLWLFVRWIPQRTFSMQSFRQLFGFGSKLLASGLLDTIYNNIYPLVIGKFFSASTLGVYSRASSLAQYPSSNLTSVLQSVTFPVLSSIQNDEERLGNAYRRLLRMSVFIIFPLMIGLSAVADPFIRLVLTDKWEGAIYLLQIVCFSMMWYPVHAINLNLLQVKGRSDYFLKLEIIKKIIGVSMLCITVPMGIVAMCYGGICTSIICLGVNTHYTWKLIGYGFKRQMREMLPTLLHALVMGAIAWTVAQLLPTVESQLIGGILSGATYYIAGAWLLKFEELQEVISIIKRKK